MALRDTLSNWRTGGSSSAANVPAPVRRSPEEQQVFDYKKEALDQARTIAAARGEDERPTLDDYFAAAQNVGKAHGLSAEEWNSKNIADLSGQTLEGFRLTEPQRQSHSKDVASNFYDHDSDGAVNDFYTNINFNDATLKDCYVEPATSFNQEVAKARSIENVTFNDMKEGDRFTFGAGSYTNIQMTNVNGGDLTFTGGQVHGLDIQNAMVASITMETNTFIENLHAENASIVKITAKPGAEIQNAHFEGATIGMESTMDGIKLTDVHFEGANLAHVGLKNAKLNHAHFEGANLAHADFTGAQLDDIHMDGADVGGMVLKGATLNGVEFNNIDPKQLDGLYAALSTATQFNDVTINGQGISSSRDLAMLRAGPVGTQLAAALGDMNNSPAAANDQFAGLLQGANLSNIIGKAEDVTAHDIGINTRVASMERTVDPNEVATRAGMEALSQMRSTTA